MNPLLAYGQIEKLGQNQQKEEQAHINNYKGNTNMYEETVKSEIEENKKVEDEINTELNILREQLTQLEKDFDNNKSNITDKIKGLEDELNGLKVEEEKMKRHYNILKEKSKKNMNKKIQNSKKNYPNQVRNAIRHLGLSNSLPPKMSSRGNAIPRNSRRNITRTSSSFKPRRIKPRSGISL